MLTPCSSRTPRLQLDDYAWHIANAHGSTHPVGEKKPNPFGLYDVYGNAEEWVEDPWREYAGPASAELTPDRGLDDRGFPKPLFPDFFGGASSQHATRGGSAASDRFGMSSAYRDHRREDSRNPYTGFRVARDIDPSFLNPPAYERLKAAIVRVGFSYMNSD